MRSEEEKTEDILYYEKKACARGFLESFEKKLFVARVICAVLTAAAVVTALGSMLTAYDSENIRAIAAIAAAIIAFSALVYIIAGALLCRSLSAFFKWRSLRAEFRSAEKIMNNLEEKFSDSTAFEPDVKKADGELLASAEKILSFANKNK